MTLDDLKGHADPVVAEAAQKLGRYQTQLAEGLITRESYDLLCADVCDLKALALAAGKEETDQMIRVAFDALCKIAANQL